jgi:acyl-homoserine lactone synthase
MQVHVIRAPWAGSRNALMEENYRLRHAVFVDLEGWTVLRRPDRRDVDRYDTGDMLHFLVTDGDELVGGARLSPLNQPNLLQTEHNGLVHGAFPADYSLGADWTRFDVCPDRREYRRCTPESAALLCAAMEYPLVQGLCFPAVFASLPRFEEATSIGWRVTPLGPPTMLPGRPFTAGLIDIFQAALANMRRMTRTGPARAWLDRERSGLSWHRPV